MQNHGVPIELKTHRLNADPASTKTTLFQVDNTPADVSGDAFEIDGFLLLHRRRLVDRKNLPAVDQAGTTFSIAPAGAETMCAFRSPFISLMRVETLAVSVASVAATEFVPSLLK